MSEQPCARSRRVVGAVPDLEQDLAVLLDAGWRPECQIDGFIHRVFKANRPSGQGTGLFRSQLNRDAVEPQTPVLPHPSVPLTLANLRVQPSQVLLDDTPHEFADVIRRRQVQRHPPLFGHCQLGEGFTGVLMEQCVQIGGQLFDARPTHFSQESRGGAGGFLIELALDAARAVDDAILHMHFSEGGSSWTPIEMAELSARATLGLDVVGPRPSLMRSASRVDWAEILAAARGIPELFEIVAQLAVGEVLLRSGALARIGSFEVQLVGQPPTVQVLIEGIFAPGQGVAGTPLQVGGTVAQARALPGC